MNFSQINLYKIFFSGDAFCVGCSHAFKSMDTISKEEITSDEVLTAGVGNLAVDAKKRTKQQALKVY